MRVPELLRIVRKVADLPNFGDKEATRSWLAGVIDASWSIPGSSLDDVVMAHLAQVVRDDGYDSLYRLLVVCLTTGRTLTPEEAAMAISLIAERAKAEGIDPETVLTVVEAIADMVQLVRDAASRSSTY